jgi:hypothetical protein
VVIDRWPPFIGEAAKRTPPTEEFRGNKTTPLPHPEWQIRRGKLMRPDVLSRLETGTAFIKDLIADVKKGEIKIPQFQRKFVWKEKQAFDLLDSIASNYPVGSLLFWKTPDKLAIERNIGDFRLPETDDLTPTSYVLDGQQRITVIYSCLGAPDSEEGFAAGFNLQNESFLEKPPQHDPLVFPLRWMYDTTKMLDFRTGLRTYPERENYQKLLDNLINAITNYRVPIVILKDLSIEEVCPIFERINSSGTKLSMFDLMVAATWSHRQFDLNEEATNIASALEAKGFDTIERDTILKCLTAVKFGGIKKEQILSLRNIPKEEMEDLVEVTSEALLKAVDLLSTEFKVYCWDFLPYEALIIVLSYICSRVDVLSGEKLVRLRQWFWRASFSERYRVGGEGFVSKDLEEIHKFIIEEQGAPDFIGEIPSAERLTKSIFRIVNSRARAFILALATKKPKNITNGAVIDTTEALSRFNKKQFHHVYPRAYLRRISEPHEHNSLVNICMLAASENSAISDTDPHVYLPKCIKLLRENAEPVFESNLLPSPRLFRYGNASYEEFLRERCELLTEYVKDLCRGTIR